jgi:hypothetical protein
VRRRLAALGAVLLALGVVYGAGRLSTSASSPVVATGQMTTVTSAVRACPGGARVAVASAPIAGDLTGTASLNTVGGSSRPLTLTTPRVASLVAAPSASGATEVTASGAMAEGLGVDQASASGVSTVQCSDPASDLWFAGTGQGAGATDIKVLLIDTDALPATVNIAVMTDSGVVQDDALSGITVGPHQTVSESLAPMVTGSQVVSLNVVSTTGRVAAAVWEGTSATSGIWLPEAAAPSTSVIIPGLSAASSASRLFVAVPGGANASIAVKALAPQGRFSPLGSTPLSAPGNAASEFALNSLGAGAAALELTSSVPITAAVLVPGVGPGAATSAAAPVTQQGVVAGNPAGGGYTTSVLLSAPSRAAMVAVTTIPAESAGTADVTVAEGHTVSVAVPIPKVARGTFAIVLTPLAGSGPLYAARVVTSGGSVVSIIPVTSAPTTIDLPAVRPTYTAILP